MIANTIQQYVFPMIANTGQQYFLMFPTVDTS